MKNNISEQTWDSISLLEIKEGHNIGAVSPLFAKVEDSDIEKQKQKRIHPTKHQKPTYPK